MSDPIHASLDDEHRVSAYDLVIRGGAVVDGSGAEPRLADVGVAGDRIRAVGDLSGSPAVHDVDATGRLVFPGFIDVHTHADALLPSPRVQEAYLRQGVTSVILGQDGISFAPTDRDAARYSTRYFAAVNGPAPDGLGRGATTADLLTALNACGSVNAGYLVPAGTLRARFVGLRDERATPAQLAEMTDAVGQAMREGALGLSSGLDYLPGAFADVDELAALCTPVARAGGVYVSHVRGYASDTIRSALEEVARVAQRSGVAAHISHLHGNASAIESTLSDLARHDGVALTFDSYPYLRGSTILAMLILPTELQAEGLDVTLTRLADRQVRHRLRNEWFPRNERLSSVTLSSLSAPHLKWAEGLSLHQAAARSGVGDLTDFVCDSLIACELAIGCVVDNGADRTEHDLRQLLRHPAQLASSDAIFVGSRPHPRGWGAFARLLARHVRELSDWSWGEAGFHLAGHAAARFGLTDRGSIAEGRIADLAVLDPDGILDNATYEAPMRPASGVSHVVVGGSIVLDDGVTTGVRAGRALRAGR